MDSLLQTLSKIPKLFFIILFLVSLTACPLMSFDDEGEEAEVITEDGLNAVAGPDQRVNGGSTVFLDGSASSDDSGNTIVSYEWEQLTNLAITLNNENSATASFEAVTPTLVASLTGIFQLTVTNDIGETDTDTVDITILRLDEPLTAQAINQTVLEQTTVYLDGSSSFDNDNNITDFLWEQISGDSVVLMNETASIAEFMAPDVADNDTTTLGFRLTVTNDDNLQDSIDVTITVNAENNDLIADAGSDQLVEEGDTVTLDGSGSTDPDDTITSYSWKQVSGSTVVFTSTDTATGIFTFTAPEVSTTEALVFRLEVTNSNAQTATDDVTINVSDAAVATTVYFGAKSSNSSGRYLWRTDGTAANTVQVAEVEVSNDATNQPIFTIDDYSYFEGYDNANGYELWRTDGTTTNTELIKSAPDSAYASGAAASAHPSIHGVVNDKLIYSAFTANDGVFNYGSLLAYDPSTESLITLFDGLPDSYAYEISDGYNGEFYFSEISYSPNIASLYVTDTTNTATVGTTDSTIAPHAGFNELGGDLIYIAGDQSLNKFDGSNYSTIKQFANDFTDFFVGDGWETHVFNGEIYFAADDNDGTGHELWKSDGTEAGTTLVKDIDGTSASSQPYEFHTVNNRLIFFVDKTSDSSVHGVWTTDGTEAGTEQLANLQVLEQMLYYEGRIDAKPVTIESLGLTFFVAQTDDEGIELWASDGTASGTYLVKDIKTTGNGHSYTALLRDGGNVLIFAAFDEEGNCANLWKSDGTESGTERIKVINEDDCGFGASTFYDLLG